MPSGDCTVRIQNSTSTHEDLTLVDFGVTNGAWSQSPPGTVASGASSGNFQVTYNFNSPNNSTFYMRYRIASEGIPYTASGSFDLDSHNQVVLSWGGAGPGNHQVTAVISGAAPHFMAIFTFV